MSNSSTDNLSCALFYKKNVQYSTRFAHTVDSVYRYL